MTKHLTLQEQLLKYMNDHDLINMEVAKVTGISPEHVSYILQGHATPMSNIKKLSDHLSPIFEDYVVYSRCACGELFIPTRDHRKYHTDECREKYGQKVNWVSKKDKEAQKKKPREKLKNAFEEANSLGLTYTEYQTKERLGLL